MIGEATSALPVRKAGLINSGTLRWSGDSVDAGKVTQGIPKIIRALFGAATCSLFSGGESELFAGPERKELDRHYSSRSHLWPNLDC